jgi:retron-type reverse transcriptase
MDTADRYLAIHNLALLQRQAGVDTGVAELVTAYGRLLIDNREPLVYDPRPFPSGSLEQACYADIREKNPDVDSRFIAFLAAYSARMTKRGFIPLTSPADLATKLGHEPKVLSAVAARAAASYREIRLPRKNGTYRIIHSPDDPIKNIQRWILRNILAGYAPHDASHGFVRGRSIVTNASQHVGHSVLIMMDIADFFPSITYRRVRKGFEKLGYPYSVAQMLANLCTRMGYLPQGAPTSPALSNLVCERLDSRLSGLARSRGFSYSRYADDMAFSSDDPRLPSLIPFLKQIIQEAGFRVNAEKTRIARKGARRVVTGIVVNEHPNLPRRQVRKLRAAAYRLARQGPEALQLESSRPGECDPQCVFAGHLGFLTMVNRARGHAIAELALLRPRCANDDAPQA